MSEAGGVRVVARNRKARHEYEVLEEVEAGMVLRGSEVKSLRAGSVSFADAFARVDNGEAWLYSLHIAPYGQASVDIPEPTRPRKLLLHRRQLQRLAESTREQGFTLVPLDVHFRNGYAKVQLALAKGKNVRDKRRDIKQREMRREVDRALRDHQRR